MPCCFHGLHGIELVSLHFPQSSCSLCIYSSRSRECWLGSIHSISSGTLISCNGILCCAFPRSEPHLLPPTHFQASPQKHPIKGTIVKATDSRIFNTILINRYKIQFVTGVKQGINFHLSHFCDGITKQKNIENSSKMERPYTPQTHKQFKRNSTCNDTLIHSYTT